MSNLEKNLNTSEKKEILDFNKTFIFLKDYGKFVYLTTIIFIVLFDYFIYTDVFHLSQADFLNYFLPSVLSQQFLIVFILFPLAITGLLMFGYKVQYDFFKQIGIKNYLKVEEKKYFFPKSILYCVIALTGDFLIYYSFNILSYSKIEFNLFSLLFILYILLAIVNIFTFKLLSGLAHVLTDKYFFTNTRAFLYILMIVFLILKIGIASFSSKYVGQFYFFIILNVILFTYIMAIFVSIEYDKSTINEEIKENKHLNLFLEISIFIGILVGICLGIWMFFSSIEDMYKKPYENFLFWDQKIYENSLSNANFSLILSPLKISQFNDTLDIEKALKDKNISKLIVDKKIQDEIKIDINSSINYLKKDVNTSKKNVFYLPNSDRKLLFVWDDNNQTDKNKTITVLHIKENNNSSIELINIGYIKSK